MVTITYFEYFHSPEIRFSPPDEMVRLLTPTGIHIEISRYSHFTVYLPNL